MGKKTAALLVAGALLAAACGGTKSAATDGPGAVSRSTAPSPPTTQRAHPTTTTTVPPAYSFDDSVPPPRLVNTGTNYIAILKSLQAYGNWAAGHRPDPALTDDFVAEGTRVSALYASDLRHLRDNNRRAFELLGRPSEYKVLSSSRDAFSARVVEEIIVQRVVDPAGRVTSELRLKEPRVYLDLVVRQRGRWYLAAADVLAPSGDEK